MGLTDRTAILLADAIEKSTTLRVLNVETNFISPPVIVKLVKALLTTTSIEEFRASNQVNFAIVLPPNFPQIVLMCDFNRKILEIICAR